MFLDDLAFKVLKTKDYAKLFLFVPKTLLSVLCAWPKTKYPPMVPRALFLYQLAFLFFLDYGIYYNIEFKVDKIGEYSFNILMVPSIFQVIFKFSTCYYKSKEMENIIDDILFKFWPYDLVNTDLKIKLRKFYYAILSLNLYILLVCFLFGIGLLIVPQLQEDKSLPFNVKYSFDYAISPIYEILYLVFVLQYFTTMVCGVFGLDLFFMSCVAATSIQYRILQQYMSAYNTNEMIDLNHRLNELNIETSSQRHGGGDVRKEFLVKFTKKINKVFDFIILIQLANSIVALCLAIYAVSQEYSDQAVLNWIALISYLGQLLTYCLLGNDLNYQASLLPDSLFRSQWRKLKNKELEKEVMFLIQHTQQIPRLSCYSLYDVDMRSFISVLKLAFSMFTVLSKMSR